MRVIRNRDFRIINFRMPQLFPFKTIETLVVNRLQSLDLALNRHISAASQDILPVFAAAR
jgi:hypothetical protein